MPFASRKQEKYLFSQHPDVARKFVADAKRAHEPMIRAADLDLYRRQIADAYRARKVTQVHGDQNLDEAAAAYQKAPTAQNYAALHAAQVASDAANAAPATPPSPQGGPTTLPATTDQPWMANYAPAPLAGTPAVGVSQAEERAEVAEGRAQDAAEAKAAADAKKPKAVGADSLVKPNAGATEEQGGASGSRPGYDVSLVGPSRTATFAAHEAPIMDPGRIAQLGQDQDAIISAQQQVGAAEQQATVASADAEQQRAQVLADQQAEIQRHAQERDAYMARQEEHIRALSDDVANEKIDPWKNKTGWDRARYAIAAALGGFVSGFRGTPNYAMQEINTQLNREMEIQREEIERKKGRIGDMRGLMADAYRRFGNLDQAESAARAVALQQFDAEQQAYAAKNGDPVQLAKSQLLSKQMQLDADKYKAGLFQYVPARTVSAGGPDPKLVSKANEIAASLVEKGDDPMEARRRAYAAVGLTASSVGGFSAGKSGKSLEDRYQTYADAMVAKGQSPVSKEEFAKQTGGEGGASAVNLPEPPQSTAYNPLAHFQGTEAGSQERQRQRYNFAIASQLKKSMGERVDPKTLMELGQGFAIAPNDDQNTINEKVQAAKDYFAHGASGAPSADAVKVAPETEE